MRILHFYKTYETDTFSGVGQVIRQLCLGGVKHGVTSEVLSLGNEPSVVSFEGHQVHRAKLDLEIASTSLSLSVFGLFAELAKKADVIHYHFPWPLMDVVHFMCRVRKPTVVTYHSDIVRQKRLLRLYRPLKNRFLASVDRIVAESPNYVATSPVLALFADKVSVIPIGLDKELYSPASGLKLDYWRERLGEHFFLFVGVLRYYKGLHILLEAAKGTEYPIVIAGDGPMEGELKKQAAALGLRNVHFLGALSMEDKVALLALCYAVVFPSHLRSEAFGIFLLEGAMFGKPMISCEIGTGTSYINIGGDTGIVVPPADPDAFREAMRYLWERPLEAAVMGERAEARYWQLFTADQMTLRYVELYRELLSGRRR